VAKGTAKRKDKKKGQGSGDDSGQRRRSWLGFGTVVLILIVLAGYGALVWYSRPDVAVAGEQLRLDQFVEFAEEGRILEATILDHDGIVTGTYERSDGSQSRFQTEYFRNGLRENLSDTLMRNFVPTRVEQQFLKTLVMPATLLTPAIIIVIVFVYLLVSYRRGTGLFGLRSGARRTDAEEAGATFDDVAGQDAAVAELRELSDFLATPQRYAEVGAQVPKGVLVYGPPGCGKTLLARALAGEAGAAFYSISGSDFVELYVGVGASRVRDLFREARDNAPAIVFIDELDSIGAKRSSGGTAGTGSHGEQEQALNQILAEMDGFASTDGLLVVGATNRPDVLDPALLRPGRFDRSVGLERPDESERLAVLKVHAADKPLGSDVDLAAIARRTVGLTGADLANVVNEAALLTGRAGNTQTGHAELEQACTRIMEAPERQRRLAMRGREMGQRALEAEQVGFDDVAGVEEATEELAEVRDTLLEPERFEAVGARAPRGVLLSGPPGCGKTLLARAVAGEANAAFMSVAATEFTEVYVGEGAARVRDLFAQVQALAPAILFIDELDAIGARRGGGTEGSRERENTLNQLLIQLDGFGPRTGVVVMAATNRPDMLDSALLRPGRFDRRVALDLPDRAARREILAVHAADKALAGDVDLDVLARRTRGLSGADLANMLNEAALLAVRRGGRTITMALVEEALDRASLGVTRQLVLSDAQRRSNAYHEAGHALAARVLDAGRMPHKVSIVARGHVAGATSGHVAGATSYVDNVESGTALRSRSQLIDGMAVALAGLAADELVYGEFDAGSASDLERATSIARTMVTRLGMGDQLGRLTYGDDGGGMGPETRTLIDAEARGLVDEASEWARAVLVANREALEAIADALMERETLLAEELNDVAGPVDRPAADAAPGTANGDGRDGDSRPAAGASGRRTRAVGS
jgi:cell division protease FtsH